jgi:MFS family permease
MGLRELFAVAPISIVACFYAGFVGSTVVNVLPLYGVGIGLRGAAISILAAMLQLGALLLQWPLGWLSDHRDRRAVMIGAALATVAGGLAVAFAPTPGFAALALLIAFGIGAAQSVYAIGVAHAFDFAGRDRTVGLSSGLMLVWGIGASTGPLVAAATIDRVGPGGLFVHAAAFSVVFVGYALWRMTRRKPRPPEEREKFVDVTATSPVQAKLDPRADER